MGAERGVGGERTTVYHLFWVGALAIGITGVGLFVWRPANQAAQNERLRVAREAGESIAQGEAKYWAKEHRYATAQELGEVDGLLLVSDGADRYWLSTGGDAASCAGAASKGSKNSLDCANLPQGRGTTQEAEGVLNALYRAELVYHALHGRFTDRLPNLTYTPLAATGYQVTVNGKSITLVVTHKGATCTLTDRAIGADEPGATAAAPFCQFI